MDTLYPLFFMNSKRFLYGSKVVGNGLDSLTRPFTSEVWVSILVLLLAFIGLFLTTHAVYKKIPEENLVRASTTRVDLIIKTIGTLTEPDPFPYFPQFSTGN